MEKINLDKIDFVKLACEAKKRINHYVIETPLEVSEFLSDLTSCTVYLKMEDMQESGSFKYRGAANYILSQNQSSLDRGIVTASTGNHANAVSRFLSKINRRGTIYVPSNTSEVKLSSLFKSGSRIEFYGKDIVETEEFVRKKSAETGQTYIPPYNDMDIISGQATVAVEISEELKNVDAVFAPVGGGGLISGIAGYIKLKGMNTEVIGCQPLNSPVMAESVKAGKIIDMDSLPTLADGTSGGIEKDAVTFEFCKRYVDKFELVTEDEIKQALIVIMEKHKKIVEGAAVLSVAAFLKTWKLYKNKTVVLILSGNKMDQQVLKQLARSW